MRTTFNSAKTGRYVTKEYADRHPATTESHQIKDARVKKKK